MPSISASDKRFVATLPGGTGGSTVAAGTGAAAPTGSTGTHPMVALPAGGFPSVSRRMSYFVARSAPEPGRAGTSEPEGW